jgi:cell division septal protein FtsQ
MIRPYFDDSSARRVRARNRKRSVLGLVLGLIPLAGAGWLGTIAVDQAVRRGWFDLDAVTVSGNRLVSTAEVKAVARCWIGKPFWVADRGRLAAALRKRYPAVRDAGCTVWPWWTLAVTIRERDAVARIESDPSTVVSPEGVFFRDSTENGRPYLRIAGTSDIGRMRAISAVMVCPAPGADWLFDPSDPQDIRVLAGGTVVHLGNGGFGEAWGKYREIRRDLEQNGTAASDIDLRYRDQGIVVLRDSSAAGSAVNN